jgi:integrase
MNTVEPIRDKKNVKALADHFLRLGQARNHALVILGVHTALRVGDLLRLRWEQVYDHKGRKMRVRMTLTEQKTKKRKTVALHPAAIAALKALREALTDPHPEDPVFESRVKGRAISRVQAYRILRDGAQAAGLEEAVSCHTLRKTFGYHSWKGGVPPALLMEIYNHSSFQVTRRYLGVSQDDKNKAYLDLTLF